MPSSDDRLTHTSRSTDPVIGELLDVARGDGWYGWLPTAEAINSLPTPIRRYIHDLETRADPSGEVRELSIARETIKALEMRLEEMDDVVC